MGKGTCRVFVFLFFIVSLRWSCLVMFELSNSAGRLVSWVMAYHRRTRHWNGALSLFTHLDAFSQCGWHTHTGGGNGGNHWRALKPIDDDVDETFHNCPHIIAPTGRRLPGAERRVANVCRRIIKNPIRRGTINMIPSLPGICPICACVRFGSISLWFYMCGGREVHVHHTNTPIIGTQLQLLH